MVTLDDVAGWAAELPDVTTGRRYGHHTWLVAGRSFAWERPFSKADRTRFGDEPVPSEPILAVRLADLGEKAAVLAGGHRGVFTIEHFEGHPSVLIELSRAATKVVRELLEEGWLAQAPPALVEARSRTTSGGS